MLTHILSLNMHEVMANGVQDNLSKSYFRGDRQCQGKKTIEVEGHSHCCLSHCQKSMSFDIQKCCLQEPEISVWSRYVTMH